MNAVVKRQAVVPAGIRPQTLPELIQFADRLARSTLIPTTYQNKPENVLVALQMGSEVGLAPLQALQSIAVINGRPALWGDAMAGLCRASPLCTDIIETVEGEGDAMVAKCVAKRNGSSPVTSIFSVADAKRATLWGKQGPWTTYPRRMLQMRARGFALRDAFPDLLRGLLTVEEARDIPRDDFKGATIDHVPEAEPPAPQPVNANALLAPNLQTHQPEPEKPTKKRTIAEWLQDLELRFLTCQRQEDIDLILAGRQVQEAMRTLRGDALEQLNALVRDALDRLQPSDFPGDAITPEDRLGA